MNGSCSWSVDWGSVPDWLGGLGSVGALVFLAVSLMREVRRQREDRLSLLMAQARLISARVHPQGERITKVIVANASRAPVFDVVLTLPETVLAAGPAEIGDQGRDDRIDSGETTEFVIRHGIAKVEGVELTYTDGNGVRWQRFGSEQPRLAVPDLPRPRGGLGSLLSRN